MIGYFDPSAVGPLLVEDASSDVCARLWNLADDVVGGRLLYVEAAAALSLACRTGS